MIAPDATIALDFSLARMTGVIEKLVVYPDQMQKNLDKLGGLINSQRILLELTQKGMSREDSYEAVQRNAMPVWLEGKDFKSLLKNDTKIRAFLNKDEIEELFSPDFHFKHVETIFERVFG